MTNGRAVEGWEPTRNPPTNPTEQIDQSGFSRGAQANSDNRTPAARPIEPLRHETGPQSPKAVNERFEKQPLARSESVQLRSRARCIKQVDAIRTTGSRIG